ncbi:MAG TPA: hypothetical protein PKH09_08085 [Parvularculaceae bacterium]|nr:hypothetical protein [Parvularculaceae bacterium]
MLKGKPVPSPLDFVKIAQTIEDNLRAFPSERFGDAKAYSAGRSGNKRRFAGERPCRLRNHGIPRRFHRMHSVFSRVRAGNGGPLSGQSRNAFIIGNAETALGRCRKASSMRHMHKDESQSAFPTDSEGW